MGKFLLLFIAFTSLAPVLASNKAIYGDFDLKDISASINYKIRKSASATALMISKHALRQEVKDSLYSIRSNKLQSKVPMCEDNFDKKELSLGNCSAFLVDKNKVLTAGHCLLHADWDCEQKAFVFDVKKEFYTDTQSQYFVKSQVYQCAKILKHVNDPDTGIDFALVELEREVTGRMPIKLSSQELMISDELYMIGNPLGISTKLSDNAFVRDIGDNLYVTTLDSFVGNSGSAVFSSSSHELMGLLARGEEDFIWNKEKKCNELVICKNDECRGEEVIKSSSILAEIESFLLP